MCTKLFTDMKLERYSSEGESEGERYEICAQLQDPCYRCQKRVYPVERVDVGVLFHRRCFRCRVCGLQLSLRTFHWDQDNEPDVYCTIHVPKLVGSIDQESMGIKTALNAPRRGVQASEQTRGSVYNPGWQYDANALEFVHCRDLYHNANQKTNTGTYKEFENLGIFDAQTELEMRQKEEEDHLYSTLKEERSKKLKCLEDELFGEKEKSVKELVSGFEEITSHREKTGVPKETDKLAEHFQKSLKREKLKIEEYYEVKREDKIKCLLEKLTSDERLRVAKLIEKQSKEMLLMIAERLSTVEDSSSDSDDRSSIRTDLSRRPPVAPPEFRRSQLIKSPSDLEKIDGYVFEVARCDYSTFTALVRDLIKDCETDIEKTRALFRWITLKDLNKMDIDDTVNPDSPMGLLRGIKYGTESYHDLFKRLCSYAGLHCEVIQGYSKGAGYKPGTKLAGDRFRNSWTAVCIEGSWCFANCNWGARHVKCHNKMGLRCTSEESCADTFSYKCDEFYFLTDPEEHIYQHFPDDPKWQLLECPINLQEFINLPVVKSSFFNYGLKFGLHYDTVQTTSNGIATFQIKIPSLLGFGYTLDPKDRYLDTEELQGRVMLKIIGHKAIFTVAPPKTGKYYFTVYAKDEWSSEILQSACAFVIKCSCKDSIKSPYPKVSFFGPTPSMSQYGIVPQTYIDPVIQYSYDDVRIQFHKHSDVRLSYTLQYHSTTGVCIPEIQRYVFIQHEDESTIAYQVRCPHQGKYVFSILGTKTNRTGDHNNYPYDCLFKYLIECKLPAKDRRPFPRVCHRWYKATLLEPIIGDLEIEQRVTFRIRATLAAEIAMMIEDAWYHFRLLADSIWEGVVFTGSNPCAAKIYAKLNKEKSRFSPLLEFQVK